METAPSSAANPLALFWARRTRGVRRFVNAAWLVEAMLPNLFVASLAATAAILVARREDWPLKVIGDAAIALVVAAVVAAIWRARRHFISEGEARTRIESGLHLHSRLSAAAAGVGPWPATDRWRSTLWRWHWRRLVVLPLCSALLVLAALLLPIYPSFVESSRSPVAKPPALEKVESLLEKLAQTPALEPSSFEGLREEAEQLAKQDPADWYSHASLEAADHLKGKLESGLKTLGDQSARLEKLLGQGASLPSESWKNQLQEALSALQGNVPGLNSDLEKALAGLDPSKLSTVPPEQLEALKKGLKDAEHAAGHQKGETGQSEAEEGSDGDDGDGESLQNGGVDRGPGARPLRLGKKQADLGTKETEALTSGDLRRASLGDAVGMSAGQHAIDKTKEYHAADGGAAAAGEGAGAVWQQQHVTPEERQRLQQFFQ